MYVHVCHWCICTQITNTVIPLKHKFYIIHGIKSHVDKGSSFFQVNGTLVTHYNHIEVVNLIKCKCEIKPEPDLENLKPEQIFNHFESFSLPFFFTSLSTELCKKNANEFR